MQTSVTINNKNPNLLKKFNHDIDLLLLSILMFISFQSKEILIMGLFFAISFIRFIICFSFENKFNKIQSFILLLFLFLSFTSLLFYIQEKTFLNPLMYIVSAFYIHFLIFTYRYNKLKTLEIIFKIFKYFVYLQVFFIFLKAPSYHFEPGDWASGSTTSAHTAGFLIGTLMISNLYNFIFSKKNFKGLAKLIFLSTAFWLTGLNQFILSVIIGLSIVFIFKNKYKKISLPLASIALFVILNLNITFTSAINLFNKDPLKIPKIAGYNTLAELYNDEPQTLLLGTSVGTYSSRASVALSSSKYLAKEGGGKLPIQHTSRYIIDYFSELYNQEVYESLIRAGVTGTFYTPFSSILALIAEYGLIGLGIIIKIIYEIKKKINILKIHDKILYYTIVTLFFSFLFVLLYENWLEYPGVFFPFLLIVITGIKKADKYRVE